MEPATILYALVAGCGLTIAAVTSVGLGRRQRRPPVALPIFIGGLLAAFSGLVTLWMQTRSAVEDYERLLRGPFSLLALASLVTLVALAVLWTGYAPRPGLYLFGVWTAGIAVLIVVLPHSILTGEITGLREVELLGQRLWVHQADGSPWWPVLGGYLLLGFGLVTLALIQQFRHGRLGDAVALTIGFGGLMVFAAYDSLVDLGLADTPYLAPLGSILLLGTCAGHLAHEVADARDSLEAQSLRLEELVQIRTVSLIEANDRLGHRLEVERAREASLAELTTAIEQLNRLIAFGPEAENLRSLIRDVLSSLGRLLDIDAARLEIDHPFDTVRSPFVVSWDPGEPVSTDLVEVARHPVQMGSRQVGAISVSRIGSAPLSEQSFRYLTLACEHVGGFLHRLELVEQMADAAVDAERDRLAREIHDSITQRLYSIAFLGDALPRQVVDDPRAASETARRIRALLLTSLAELRAMLYELQPAAFESASLANLLVDLGSSASGPAVVEVEVPTGELPALPPNIKLAFYRIAQEAVSNAWRHSRADHVTISLDESGDELVLDIRDDGVGFDESAIVEGHGLSNLRRRAEEIGAGLTIDSRPGVGSAVTASVRWTDQASEDRAVRERVGHG